MMADFLVTFDHLHSMPGGPRPGWCHKGGREFAVRYNLSWPQMLQDGGVKASVLIATGDAMAARLVEHARKQNEVSGG